MTKKQLWNVVAVLALLAGLLAAVPGIYHAYRKAEINHDMRAAVNNLDAARIKLLIAQGADPKTKGEVGLDALFAAADAGDTALGRELIHAGVSAAASKTTYGQTPLMHAATRGYTTFVVLLLDAGTNPNMRDSAGESALMFAAGSGQTRTVRALLDAGADPTFRSRGGGTARSLAQKYHRAPEITAMLKTAEAEARQAFAER